MEHNSYLDHTKVTIAATEYVISKYNHHSWFNHQLRAILKSLLILPNTESSKGPLIIHTFKNNNGEKILHRVSGYHYLIEKMDEFDRLTSLPNVFSLKILMYCLCVTLLAFLFYFYRWYFNEYDKILINALKSKKEQ